MSDSLRRAVSSRQPAQPPEPAFLSVSCARIDRSHPAFRYPPCERLRAPTLLATGGCIHIIHSAELETDALGSARSGVETRSWRKREYTGLRLRAATGADRPDAT